MDRFAAPGELILQALLAMTESHVGTSGWHYKHWREKFYPAGISSGEMFAWYTKTFSTVEINNTFYRLPTDTTFLNWRRLAPIGFLFSVKASGFITHRKRLLDPQASVENFFSRVELLGDKLGPILFQLPPKWRVNVGRLKAFLNALPPQHLYAFEFRDASWAVPQVFELLRRYNAAMCIHDWQGIAWPHQMTANFAYFRFHGPMGNYSGSYTPSALAKIADDVRRCDSPRGIFVYFNNDLEGFAVKNAKLLRKLLHSNSAGLLASETELYSEYA